MTFRKTVNADGLLASFFSAEKDLFFLVLGTFVEPFSCCCWSSSQHGQDVLVLWEADFSVSSIMLHSTSWTLKFVVLDQLTNAGMTESVTAGKKSRHMGAVFFKLLEANLTSEGVYQTIHSSSYCPKHFWSK